MVISGKYSLARIGAIAALLVLCTTASAGLATASEENRSTLNLIDRLPAPFAERFVVSLNARQALHAMQFGIMTSEQYTEILLQRIANNATLNAVIHVDAGQALAAARAADARRRGGTPAGLLDGLPILVKDSIHVAGLPATSGTPALAGFVPDSHAAVVQALVDAGAIVLGKTNLHELQAGYTTVNAFTGPTLNPYDFSRSPGGSSGGNGAALAARLAPVALGADTAGSVRVPAALNGVLGFRPTGGRYPQDGIAMLSETLDTVGPMGRDVRDLALLDAVMTGTAPGLEHVRLDGLRIGVPRAYFQEHLDPDVEEALRRMLWRLRSAGVVLVFADIPEVGEATQTAALAIALFEALGELTEYLAVNETGVSLPELAGMVASPDVAFLLSSAITAGPTPEQYQAIITFVQPALEAVYVGYLESNDLDAVLLPTNVVPAPALDAMAVDVDGVTMPIFDAFFRLGHYAPLVRAPTLSLPIGQLRDGLPVGGIDIAGRPGDDRRLLAIGVAIEKALPVMRPPRNIRPMPFPVWRRH